MPATARLFVYAPTHAPRVIPLKGETFRVGRADSNELRLNDARASSAHAQLERRRDTRRWVLTDLGSTNGTFIGGRRVTEAVLEQGSVLRMGDTLVVFETGVRTADVEVADRSIEAVAIERQVERVSAGDAPLLILGPTGAGKGHLAREIIARSPRPQRAVHVNCAALPRELVESELFGHEKGAFTGATSARAGLIEEADGGTLFLDEIGTLEPALQAKLLIAVEEGTVRRVGATTTRPVNVRYLAATNVDIEQAIESGAFREDLYYRLAAHTITLPPLVARRPDIVPILAAALGQADHRAFCAECLEALLIWSWPGNVRELLNVARTLEVVGPPIDYGSLPPAMTAFLRERADGAAVVRPNAGCSAPRDDATAEAATVSQLDASGPQAAAAILKPRSKAPSREALARALEDCDGNVTELARRLDKHRNQVVRWLDAYGMR